MNQEFQPTRLIRLRHQKRLMKLKCPWRALNEFCHGHLEKSKSLKRLIIELLSQNVMASSVRAFLVQLKIMSACVENTSA